VSRNPFDEGIAGTSGGSAPRTPRRGFYAQQHPEFQCCGVGGFHDARDATCDRTEGNGTAHSSHRQRCSPRMRSHERGDRRALGFSTLGLGTNVHRVLSLGFRRRSPRCVASADPQVFAVRAADGRPRQLSGRGGVWKCPQSGLVASRTAAACWTNIRGSSTSHRRLSGSSKTA
jgi:hypothetical protein